MPATAQKVLDRARIPLNDDEKIRYLDNELLVYLNEGVQCLRRDRPDLFIGSLGNDIADIVLNDTLSLSPMHIQSLADYITARAESKDADMSDQGRAAAFLALSRG